MYFRHRSTASWGVKLLCSGSWGLRKQVVNAGNSLDNGHYALVEAQNVISITCLHNGGERVNLVLRSTPQLRNEFEAKGVRFLGLVHVPRVKAGMMDLSDTVSEVLIGTYNLVLSVTKGLRETESPTGQAKPTLPLPVCVVTEEVVAAGGV